MLKVGIVVNLQAGGGIASQNWPEIAQALKSSFDNMIIFTTLKKGDGISLARQALKEGCVWIVAIGGDGTVNEVVNGILEVDPPFTVRFSYIMIGRGNDFRRNFSPLCDWRLDLQCILKRHEEFKKEGHFQGKKIDVGRATFKDDGNRPGTRFFINHASCGVSSEINKIFNSAFLYKRMRGLVAYGLATLQTLLFFRNRTIILKADDLEKKRLKSLLVLISNGKSAAGGMKVAPQADLSDGLLDMLVFGDFGRIESFMQFPKFIFGTHLPNSKIFYMQGKKMEIFPTEGESGTMSVELDGEVVGTLPATFEIIPGRLELII